MPVLPLTVHPGFPAKVEGRLAGAVRGAWEPGNAGLRAETSLAYRPGIQTSDSGSLFRHAYDSISGWYNEIAHPVCGTAMRIVAMADQVAHTVTRLTAHLKQVPCGAKQHDNLVKP